MEKKTELNEEFITMWREEQSLWDVMSPLYQNKASGLSCLLCIKTKPLGCHVPFVSKQK